MRIGIGLPAAIPAAASHAVVEWAVMAEATGFESVGVIDRLVYDNLDPLVALAAAAATTQRIELLTTVLNVPWRRNGVVLAKQLASLDRISGGRLTAGLGLGGWPDDHAAVGPAPAAGGVVMDQMLAEMRAVWTGQVGVGSAAIPALAPSRPSLLIGGLVPAAYRRVARHADGWVAPSFGYEALTTGIRGVRHAWEGEGRTGRPRVVVERYFSLGAHADETAQRYLHHYYGDEYVAAVLADTITSADRVERELSRLAEAGCDDVVLLPCDSDIRQVERLAGALDGLRASA